MSTKITYKGSTIASFANTTKTLKTSGKYMEGDVAVTETITLQSKTVAPTTTSQTITADSGYEGLSTVTVEAAEGGATFIWDEADSHGGTIRYISTGNIVSDTKNITANGTYNVASFYSASVNVQPTLQSKTVSPTEAAQNVTPDTGYQGLSKVTVNAISNTYVGTSIARKSSADVTFASATGTFTAPIGYYSAAATKTIATKAAATIYPSTANQTIASYQWLTGNQTIAAVTTANLTAANIVNGVTVKVGDASNASRIAQVTGTYAGIIPTGTISITAAGNTNVTNYATASVRTGTATTPATTITTNPTVTIASATGVVTGTYTGSSNITPTVASGWIATGTSGKVTTTGTGTLNLTTQAAQTINTSTADQTIASYRWLTGTQTIKSVTTANIEAGNIKSGVTVKVGDANSAGRIKNVTGTLVESPTYTCTVHGTGNSSYCYVQHNNTKYYTNGNTFSFHPGDSIYCSGRNGSAGGALLTIGGGVFKTAVAGNSFGYSLVTIGCNIDIYLNYQVSDDNPTTINVFFTNDLLGLSFATVTPTKSSQTLSTPGSYYGLDTVMVDGDDNLIPANIASGVSIFGVSGTHTGGNPLYELLMSSMTMSASILQPYLSGLTSITTPMFIDKQFRTGSYYFNDVTSIETNAFHRNSELAYTGASATFYFPKITSIPTACFQNAKYLQEIVASSCLYIGSSAFTSCTSLKSVSFNSCITMGYRAFQGCTGLTSLYFPNCTSMESYVFSSCSYVTTANFPECTNIGSFAFYACNRMSSIIVPKCVYVYDSAFAGCWSLSAIYIPSCSYIGFSAFYGCRSLSSVVIGSCSMIGSNAFRACSALLSIDFQCTQIGSYAFADCSALETAKLFKCESIESNTFGSCFSLHTVCLSACSAILTSAFYRCHHLLSLYILYSSVASLTAGAFFSTPISGNTTSTGGVYGSIFVRSSLLTSYQTAANWSAFSARMVGLTDAQVQNVINYGRHDP